MDDALKLTDKVTTIPQDALIQITISGAFYGNLQQLAVEIASREKDPAIVAKSIKELETRGPNTDWEAELLLILALCKAVEEGAKEQNLTKLEPVSAFLDDDSAGEDT